MAYGDTLTGGAQGIEQTMLAVDRQAERCAFSVGHIGQELADQRQVPLEPLQIFLGAARKVLDPGEWILKLREVGWI